jgi:hypothetical protein
MNKIKYNIALLVLISTLYTEGSFAQGITMGTGAKLVIGSGSYVVSVGNVSNSGSTTVITNNGTLATDGNLSNNFDGTLNGNGTYKVGRNWSNSSTFTAGTSTVELMGDNPSSISNFGSFYNLTLNKTTVNPIVSMSGDTRVTNTFTFSGTGNKLDIGFYYLRVSNPFVGYDATKYIITNGFGGAVATTVGSTPFVFPIGISSTSYMPITISQTGTPAPLAVSNLSFSASGISLTSGAVNKVWAISEDATPGLTPLNLTLTPQWNGSDQLSGFDNAKCGVSKWDFATAKWDLTYPNVGARVGSDPYTRTRSGITSVGTYAVGSKAVAGYIQLSAKVFLQGAYASASLMTDALRTGGVSGANLIPLLDVTNTGGTTPTQGTQPNGFVHQGFGGGEMANTIGVFSPQPSTADNIVDWVYVELRNTPATGASTVLHTRSALLQRDGDIVNEDGTSPLKIYGVPDGSYHISIRHRNHIAVRSAMPKSLSQATTTVMDFTTNLSEALATFVTAGYNALATMADGKFAMWGGNVNSDASTRRDGPASINDATLITNYYGVSTNSPKLNVYRREDVNMNGSVYRAGPAAINDPTKLISYLGLKTIVTQPTF